MNRRVIQAACVLAAVVILGVVYRFGIRRSAVKWSSQARTRSWLAGTGLGTSHGATSGASGTSPYVQPGLAPRHVAGRVTFEGAPVAGAIVRLWSGSAEAGAPPELRVVTSGDGAFDLGVVPAGWVLISAEAEGKTAASEQVLLSDPTLDPAPDRLELVLTSCSFSVYGAVTDASGGPIVRARVQRGDVGYGSAAGAVETDDGGAFKLCTAPGEDTEIEIRADGYGAISVRRAVYGPTRLDVEMVPEATIIGRVVRADDGSPVEGIAITTHKMGGRDTAGERMGRSDAAGKFLIVQVKPGTVTLSAAGPGYTATEFPKVTLQAGKTSDEIIVRVAATSTVRGKVVTNAKPVAGVTVYAQPGGSAVSQVDGTFTLTGIPRGDVELGTWPHAQKAPEKLVVNASVLDGVVLEVVPRGAIHGLVTCKGKPAAGALVRTEQGVHQADAKGRFALIGLDAGVYTLNADSDFDGAFGDPVTVELAEGEEKRGVVIDLQYAASASGVVVNQDGVPLEGMPVIFSLIGGKEFPRATSGPDGRFRVGNLRGGASYRTMVHGKDVMSGTLTPVGGKYPVVVVKDGASQIEGLRLQVKYETKATSGTVADSKGKPVPDVTVVAALESPDGVPRFSFPGAQTTTTDRAGAFSFPSLQAGLYALRASTASGRATIIRKVPAGGRGIVISLLEPGRVEGTLVDFANPWVVAHGEGNQQENHQKGVVTGSTFTIEGLSPGTYVIQAVDGPEIDATKVDSKSGVTTRVVLRNSGHGSISGRVLALPGMRPVEGAECSAIVPGGWSASRMTTDASGSFELQAPAGPTGVSCFSQTVTHGRTAVTLARDGRAKIDVIVVNDFRGTGGYLGVQFSEHQPVAIEKVFPDTPAARAGLRVGETIMAVDGADVSALIDDGVRELITGRAPGSPVSLTLRQGTDQRTVTFTLGKRPDDDD